MAKQTKQEALAIAAGRPLCLCGCGGYPKGKKARYLPGHDAKHHSAQKKARTLSALQGDELALQVTDEWNLPTDRVGFLAWLEQAGVSLDDFRTYPAWRNAPPDLQAALVAPARANTRGRAPRPSVRAAQRGDTSRAVGKDAKGRADR
jgi:hypothetical protein